MDQIDLTKDYALRPFDLQRTVKKVDLTLKDLFDIVYESDLQHGIIAECLGLPNFMRFYEEIQQPAPPKQDPKLHYIELYWSREYSIERAKSGRLEQVVEQAELSSQMDVHAIGEHWKADPNAPPMNCPLNCTEHNGYAIEFTPLNELAHLQIKVSPEIKYEKMTITTHPTLYQIINSIFWELTFSGYDPTERDEAINKIIAIKEEAEEQLLIKEGNDIFEDMIPDKEKEEEN